MGRNLEREPKRKPEGEIYYFVAGLFDPENIGVKTVKKMVRWTTSFSAARRWTCQGLRQPTEEELPGIVAAVEVWNENVKISQLQPLSSSEK